MKQATAYIQTNLELVFRTVVRYSPLREHSIMTDEELRLLITLTPEQLFQLVDLVNKAHGLLQDHPVQDIPDFRGKLIQLLSEDDRLRRSTSLFDQSWESEVN